MDAVRIESRTMKMDQAEGMQDHFEARVLVNTREAWPAPTMDVYDRQ